MSVKSLKEQLLSGQTAATHAAAAPRPKIVIVDDDEGVLKSLRVVLRNEYDVVLCSNSIDAASVVKAARPDAVVLDIRMPVKDGFMVFQEIRQFDALVPIIFNSAYQDIKEKNEIASQYKAFHYLSKSGNIDEFRSAVANAVAHAHKIMPGR